MPRELRRRDGRSINEIARLAGVSVSSASLCVRDIALTEAQVAALCLGLGSPALLEVFGEQNCGTVFLLAGGEEVEVHRPGVPWDRPGPATDMSALAPRLLAPAAPSGPTGADPSPLSGRRRRSAGSL